MRPISLKIFLVMQMKLSLVPMERKCPGRDRSNGPVTSFESRRCPCCQTNQNSSREEHCGGCQSCQENLGTPKRLVVVDSVQLVCTACRLELSMMRSKAVNHIETNRYQKGKAGWPVRRAASNW